MTVFDLLHPRVQDILEDFDFTSPTPPQKVAIPKVMDGRNLLLVAPTGIGKTEAAMLPILSWIVDTVPEGNAVIYITPLRALNRDMLRRLKALGDRLGISVGVRHADTSRKERTRQSKDPPQVMITTPETLQIMLQGKRLRVGLGNVHKVVVDEIHELADNERGAQLSVALERLEILAQRPLQRIGLSATVGSPREVGDFLVGKGRTVDTQVLDTAKNVEVVVDRPSSLEPGSREEDMGLDADILGALTRCREIIDDHEATLFFVNTRDTAEFLTSRALMMDEEFPISVHHGSLSKSVRVKAEDAFREQRLKALVCTSSLELGIDIGSTDYTIQFNSPRQVTRLVQRVGRAGHGVGRTSEGTIITLGPDDIAESCVIARRAMAGELEEIDIRQSPLSVLANQIIAMSLEHRRDWDEVYRLVTTALPFKDLSRKDFDRVLRQLVSLYRVWYEEKDRIIGRKKRGFKYFYDNISMIPDERTFRVRDITTRGIVGTLDENFVVSNLAEGSSFIVKGRPWRLVELREDEVLVEPTGIEGSIPHWIGEEIPVPFEVAQEVGRMRRELDPGPYPCDAGTFKRFEECITDHGRVAPIPDDGTILIEISDRAAVLHGCFGSKVNETLGRIMSSFLSARYGSTVGMRSDPYRIVLDLPGTPRPEDLVSHLKDVDPGAVESLLRIVLRNSSLIKWNLLHTARKFGAIDRDVDLHYLNIQRLIRNFDRTPLLEETISKLIWERMDVERTASVLADIRSGRIALVTRKGKPSPLGLLGLEAAREFLAPAHADRQILMSLKKRLEKEYVRLACFNCDGSVRKKIKEMPEDIECPLCGGKLVAVLHPRSDSHKLLKKRRKHKLDKDEMKELGRLKKNANVVLGKGRRGALAMAARGVGPRTAVNILKKPYDSEEDFMRAILAAEIHYARTKRFWD